MNSEALDTHPRVVWPAVSTDSVTGDVPGSTPQTSRAAASGALGPVPIRRLDDGLPVPSRAHPGDAGVDLQSTVDIRIDPGERAVVGTGVAVALPHGTVGLVHPRSGLAARTGLSIANTPGTIDAGYRGEIKVCLINHDRHDSIAIARGDRIAQLLVQRVELVDFVEVSDLDETSRGSGGYGSSGGHSVLTKDGTDESESRGQTTERGA